MSNVKIQCSCCGNTNTKFEAEYVPSGFLGLSSTKVGEHEVINTNAGAYYRCIDCGRFYCSSCYDKTCCKSALGFISKKNWTECPKCKGKEFVNVN
jgi:hypothetical protein